jgi:hypothetical protein
VMNSLLRPSNNFPRAQPVETAARSFSSSVSRNWLDDQRLDRLTPSPPQAAMA